MAVLRCGCVIPPIIIALYSNAHICSTRDCFFCLRTVQTDRISSMPNNTRINNPISRNGNWYGTILQAKDFLLSSIHITTETGTPTIKTVRAAKNTWHIPSIIFIRHSCFPVRPMERRMLLSRFLDIWLESVVLIRLTTPNRKMRQEAARILPKIMLLCIFSYSI